MITLELFSNAIDRLSYYERLTAKNLYRDDPNWWVNMMHQFDLKALVKAESDAVKIELIAASIRHSIKVHGLFDWKL